jgi:ankyrin repeat protein
MQEQVERNEMLAWACARGLLQDVAALVSQGAAVNGRDRRGRTPAHFAAARAHAPVLEYLAGRGCDLEAEDARGRTAAHYAALSDVAVDAALRTAAEQQQLQQQQRRRQGASAAAAAAEAAAAAADAAGGPDLLDDRTPTQRAQAAALGARGSGAEAIAVLARRAPAWLLDAADGADDTPLHLACRHGAADAARALLRPPAPPSSEQAGADAPSAGGASAGGRSSLTAVNKRGLTPLAEALAGGLLGCAAALVAEGADVSSRVAGGGAAAGNNPMAGFTLLHLAAAAGQVDSVQYLLDCAGAGAGRGRGGGGGQEPPPALLEDRENADGATPLHAAAAAGSAACAELLLRAGADWRAETKAGLRAADLVPDACARAEALRAMLRTGEVAAAASAAAPAAGGGGGGKGGWLGGLLSTAVGAASGVAAANAPSGPAAPAPSPAVVVADASAKATPAAPASAAKGAAAPPSRQPKTLAEQIAALPNDQERRRRVDALARGTPDAALDALVAAGELTEPQAEALRTVRRIGHVLAASRLVRMLRRDEQFQDDATDPRAVEAMAKVRQAVGHAAALGRRANEAPAEEKEELGRQAFAAAEAARVAEDKLLRGDGADPAAANVASKLRGLHARLREEAGGLKVTIEDLINVPASVPRGSEQAREMKEKSLRDADGRVSEFEAAVDEARGRAVAAMVEGAAAAAGGGGGDKEMDLKEEEEEQRPARREQQKQVLRERAAAVEEAAAAAVVAGGEAEQEQELPFREQLWRSFRESSLRALRAIGMTVLMVVLLWATGTLPGQTGGWMERLRERMLAAQQQQQPMVAATAATAADAADVAAAAAAAAALPTGHPEL